MFLLFTGTYIQKLCTNKTLKKLADRINIELIHKHTAFKEARKEIAMFSTILVL